MSAANFDAAVQYVHSLPKDGPVQLDTKAKLEFYSLFKQATMGNVKGSRPWAVQLEARAKWDAWHSRKGMSADAAKEAYVKRIIAVLKSRGIAWPPAATVRSKL